MKQYNVDAFTSRVFHGNQAAVCVLDEWIPVETMMNITRENNYSETAFTVKTADGYDLRWFTPGGEINLCGHATLGTAYVLLRFYEHAAQNLVFHTLSGDLFINREGEFISMDFPAYQCHETEVTELMSEAFGARPLKAFLDRDLLLVFDDEEVIRNMTPDFSKVRLLDGLCVGVTAPGSGYDCVSRVFAPKLKVNEDPVTGSTHCMITPYWSERLGKKQIHAYQASGRGGELFCKYEGSRVKISGKTALYSIAELNVDI